MISQLSILGLLSMDPDLFNEMVVPDGLEKDDVVNFITLDAAELNVVYPDPDFMRLAIQLWSKTRLSSWTRQYKALKEEYDPLWNKDGTVTETRDIDNTTKVTGSNTNSVQGFNSSAFSDASKNTTSSDGTGKTKETVTRKEYGNIGITMSQDMLKAEIDVRKTDIYQLIADDFKRRFCVLVY